MKRLVAPVLQFLKGCFGTCGLLERQRVGISALAGAVALFAFSGSGLFAQSTSSPRSRNGCGAPVAATQSPAARPANGPMTAAQGAAILAELHAIRLLLQNGALQRGVTRRPARPHSVRLRVEPGWYKLGSAGAPVTIVEFTDLQCPFCRRFHRTTFGEIKKDYIDTGKVRFIAGNLPLRMHVYALGAAEAVLCAGDQGKFWQFRGAVLDDQTPPTSDVLLKHAKALELNIKEFQGCVSDGKHARAIQADRRDAAAVGLHGTPAFVIGRVREGWLDGVAMQGARPFAFFQQEIEQALLRQATAPARTNAPYGPRPAAQQ